MQVDGTPVNLSNVTLRGSVIWSYVGLTAFTILGNLAE